MPIEVHVPSHMASLYCTYTENGDFLQCSHNVVFELVVPVEVMKMKEANVYN